MTGIYGIRDQTAYHISRFLSVHQRLVSDTAIAQHPHAVPGTGRANQADEA